MRPLLARKANEARRLVADGPRRVGRAMWLPAGVSLSPGRGRPSDQDGHVAKLQAAAASHASHADAARLRGEGKTELAQFIDECHINRAGDRPEGGIIRQADPPPGDAAGGGLQVQAALVIPDIDRTRGTDGGDVAPDALVVL